MPTTDRHINDHFIFGLDIGTRSIVGMVGYLSNNQFHIVASHIIEHTTRSMIDGQIHDVPAVAKTIRAVKEVLEERLSMKLTKVCIAAAGRVLKTANAHVETELDANTVIDEDRVYSLELLGMERAHQWIRSQAQEGISAYHCVGYTVSKYYLNDYEISNLVGHKGKKMGADILATFLPQEVVESLYAVVAAADMEVYSLTLEPIAAIQVAIPNQFRLLNIALIDIGAGTSDIAITKDGSIIAYGMIPIAGDEITETIVHKYLVDFATAEMIKIKASSKSKNVTFKDIIGIKHQVPCEEIREVIRPAIFGLAQEIGKKIIELNGQKSTNAVFVVGGGGQVKSFTDYLAESLGIAPDRVALRGQEVLGNVIFEESSIKVGPELVTPVGICYTGLTNNKHDFIEVYLNDEPIRIFNNNKLCVMDIAALKGYDPQKLISKRGADLSFSVNGVLRIIKGEMGIPAKIMINHEEAGLTSMVSINDYVTIVPAKRGQDASYTITQLLETLDSHYILYEHKRLEFTPYIYVNNQHIKNLYTLHEGDQVRIEMPTLEDVLIQNDLNLSNGSLFLNEEPVSPSTCVKTGDFLVFFKNSAETPQVTKQEVPIEMIFEVEKPILSEVPLVRTITVFVNGARVQLSGKASYVFVDVFEVIDFDLRRPKGDIVCKINNEKASYMATIDDGDQMEIYWV